MRAVIYCRVSLDRSGEEMAVTRQMEDCKELVAQLGWHLVETYVDNDISAVSGKPRPEYRRMLKALEAGEVDVIVAWAPDRIYRRVADLDELIKIIDKRDVAIRTVKAGEFDLSTGMGKMLARILGSVAQGEGDMKSERYRRSIRQRREAGTPPKSGPRLFGYLHDGSIVEDEARIVRWLAEALIDGEPVIRLASKVNDLGMLTTRGNPWTRISLRRLMMNHRLAGRATLNGDVVGVGQWEPILDEEAFEQVQAILSTRQGTGVPRAPRRSLLTGLALCYVCGQPLKSGRRQRTKPGQQGARIYICRKPPDGEGCGQVSVAAEPVEVIIEGAAKDALTDPRVRAHLASLSEQSGDKTAEVIDLEERLLELEAQLDQPGVPVATITRAISRTQERIDTLRAQVALAPRSLPRIGQWPEDLASRARLVRLVVLAVVIKPATRGGNVFDERRVLPVEVQLE